jgi:hypothetical protein
MDAMTSAAHGLYGYRAAELAREIALRSAQAARSAGTGGEDGGRGRPDRSAAHPVRTADPATLALAGPEA